MANGKHTDNGVDQRIVKFIGRHHVMTIASAATECGPYCANLFYAYIPNATFSYSPLTTARGTTAKCT